MAHKKKTSILDKLETAGNKLPHPTFIFIILSGVVILLSGILSFFNINITFEGINRTTFMPEETTVSAISLMTMEGIQWMLTSMVKNFTAFPPLGVVLVAMIGIGLAEQTGLITVLLKRIVAITPAKLLTPVMVFIGVMTNIASDVGYVVLIPLGAITYLSFNRHPLAGIAATFAGVSGGFSANLLLGTIDPLLGGITAAATQLLDPTFNTSLLTSANYYFMIVSTFLITGLGWFITDKIVEPRLGTYVASDDINTDSHQDLNTELTPLEQKALRAALVSMAVYIGVLLLGIIPQNGFLRGDDGSLLHSPLIKGVVVLVAFGFFIPGLVFGLVSKEITNTRAMIHALDKTMSSMGPYIVLSFFAAQFIAYFNYTKLGTIFAVSGAEFLKDIGFVGLPLVLVFIVLAAFINLFIGSASAKWAIMAPIFVPMFMRLGYEPGFVQLAYRIGDSTTNIITPLMSYYAIVIIFAQRYDKKVGIGTLISMMLPYSIYFLLSWSLLLVIWFIFQLPIGPDVSIFLSNVY